MARGSEVTRIPASSLIGEGKPAILDCNGGIKIDAVSSFFYPLHLLFRATMLMFFCRACSQVSPRAGALTVLQPGSEDGEDQRGSIKQLGCFLLLLLGGGTSREEQTGPGPRSNAPVLRPLVRVRAFGCALESAGPHNWPVKHSQAAFRPLPLAVELAEH